MKEKLIFIFIGSVNTIFGLVINYLLYRSFINLVDYKVIVFCATIVSLIFNFTTYNLFLYKQFDTFFLRLFKFFLASIIMIFVSMGVFILFYGFLKFQYEVTILISLVFSMFYSYFTNKFFIFKNHLHKLH